MFTVKVNYKLFARDVADSVGGSLYDYTPTKKGLKVRVIRSNKVVPYYLDNQDIDDWLVTNIAPNITARHYANIC